MATAAQWLEGARPRTLFMSLAPVVAGSGAAAYDSRFDWWRALLALVVALALQVGVNYANDYSDGIRGTDADRVGPLRLVGSGAASPGAVKAAAFACFAVAGVAGIVLALVSAWWLILVGAASIVAAWLYTGGSRPYGYAGLGEVAVFVFFGLVAVCGTAFVQTKHLTLVSVVTAIPIGLLACALLVANNLRDIPGDTLAGKRTLAVRLGDARTRYLFAALILVGVLFAVLISVVAHNGAPLMALGAGILIPATLLPVLSGRRGPELIPTLKHTGQVTLLFAVLVAIGLAVS